MTWQKSLVANRRCQIDFRCVHSYSGGIIEFAETSDPLFSTQHQYLSSDKHELNRSNSTKYEVESISLCDLLVEHNSPTRIDYLSIDTEGSELEILSKFDFLKYRIRIISVEHNFTPNREKIRDLLIANGYTQKFKYVSLFDDWYVLGWRFYELDSILETLEPSRYLRDYQHNAIQRCIPMQTS